MTTSWSWSWYFRDWIFGVLILANFANCHQEKKKFPRPLRNARNFLPFTQPRADPHPWRPRCMVPRAPAPTLRVGLQLPRGQCLRGLWLCYGDRWKTSSANPTSNNQQTTNEEYLHKSSSVFKIWRLFCSPEYLSPSVRCLCDQNLNQGKSQFHLCLV